MKSEIHIASPCSADWNKMAGDARGRHCAECNLDVYNFSEMSDADISRIIAEREGRLCARFYQRSDGDMLTQDCPAGFRAVARRLSRFASLTVVFPNFNTLKRNHVSMPSQTELKLQLDLAALMGVVTIVSEPQPETAAPPVSKKLSDPPPAKPK